mmetsp:Transcript_7833/g.22490  ORF Transcript_7833/g.22490 Transcript_7833/m.22490 type:complete len:210 (-) Transcript_7833:459-1088(-)
MWVKSMTSKPESRPTKEDNQQCVAAASGSSSAKAMQHMTPPTETSKSSMSCAVTNDLRRKMAHKAPSGSARPATIAARVALARDRVASNVVTARVRPSGMLWSATAMQIEIPKFRPANADTATAKPSGMLCAVSAANSSTANRLLCCWRHSSRSSRSEAMAGGGNGGDAAPWTPWPECRFSAASPSRQQTRQASALMPNKSNAHQGSRS